jgi:hypothetical protein
MLFGGLGRSPEKAPVRVLYSPFAASFAAQQFQSQPSYRQ